MEKKLFKSKQLVQVLQMWTWLTNLKGAIKYQKMHTTLFRMLGTGLQRIITGLQRNEAMQYSE